MAYDVFISHAEENSIAADAVCAALEARGVRCWISPRDAHPDPQGREVAAAIEASRVVVLVFSKQADESDSVRAELAAAADAGAVIVPMRIDGTGPTGSIELVLSDTHWLDASDPPTEQQIGALADTVEAIVRTGAAGPRSSAKPAKRWGWAALLLVFLAIGGVGAAAALALRKAPEPSKPVAMTSAPEPTTPPTPVPQVPVEVKVPTLKSTLDLENVDASNLAALDGRAYIGSRGQGLLIYGTDASGSPLPLGVDAEMGDPSALAVEQRVSNGTTATLLYAAHAGVPSSAPAHVEILDVTDPGQLNVLAEVRALSHADPGVGTLTINYPSAMSVRDGTMVLGSDGYQVFDVSTPSKPKALWYGFGDSPVGGVALERGKLVLGGLNLVLFNPHPRQAPPKGQDWSHDDFKRDIVLELAEGSFKAEKMVADSDSDDTFYLAGKGGILVVRLPIGGAGANAQAAITGRFLENKRVIDIAIGGGILFYVSEAANASDNVARREVGWVRVSTLRSPRAKGNFLFSTNEAASPMLACSDGWLYVVAATPHWNQLRTYRIPTTKVTPPRR